MLGGLRVDDAVTDITVEEPQKYLEFVKKISYNNIILISIEYSFSSRQLGCLSLA